MSTINFVITVQNKVISHIFRRLGRRTMRTRRKVTSIRATTATHKMFNPVAHRWRITTAKHKAISPVTHRWRRTTAFHKVLSPNKHSTVTQSV
jgi:hypothetical protein